MGHFEQHSILTDAQYGFHSKRSCETQLITTIQDLARGMSDGHQIDAILLDFAKALDKVPHQRLLYKLHHYGIRGPTLNSWIESFLTGRIFDFFSGTTEQNSSKLDKKLDLNIFYQVCVFRAKRKNKKAALASDWLRQF